MNAIPPRTARDQAAAFVRHATVDNPTRDLQLAYRELSSACVVDPTYALGWFALGNAHSDLDLLPAATASFRRALELPDGSAKGEMNDELRAQTLVNLGHRLYHQAKLAEARDATEAAIALRPTLAFAWANLSMIASAEGRCEEAVRLARRGYELAPSEVLVELALGFALLFNGDLETGLRHFEARIPYKLPHYLQFPYQRWHGEHGADRTLFVVADQGMGDTLCYARFIRAARQRVGHVVVMVQWELIRLLQATHNQRGSGIEFIPLESTLPAADWWCPIVSLPVALGLVNGNIVGAPRLPRPVELPPLPHGWKAPGRKLHIGIAWGGSPANEIDRWRSLSIEAFLRLYEVPGVQLYSLQVGPRAAELHTSGCAALVSDLAVHIRDAMDTAAFIAALDLVVCVESFVGWLCAAVDRPALVVTAYHGGDYRFGRHRESPIWAPMSRIMRQGPDHDWGPVWDAVVADVRARVACLQ